MCDPCFICEDINVEKTCSCCKRSYCLDCSTTAVSFTSIGVCLMCKLRKLKNRK